MINVDIFSTYVESIPTEIVQFIDINSCESIAYQFELPGTGSYLVFEYLVEAFLEIFYFFVSHFNIWAFFGRSWLILRFGNLPNNQCLNPILRRLQPLNLLFLSFRILLPNNMFINGINETQRSNLMFPISIPHFLHHFRIK